MGNDKSKRTGTLHLKATPESDKLTATTTGTTDSTAPVLETDRTPPDMDAALKSDGANASPIEGASIAEHGTEAPDTPAANVPTSSTDDADPVSAAAASSSEENSTQTEPVSETQTKMEMATEIFVRMKKTKGMTRKEIIAAFVVDAKLSKAGASTYYQLIKAKIEET